MKIKQLEWFEFADRYKNRPSRYESKPFFDTFYEIVPTNQFYDVYIYTREGQIMIGAVCTIDTAKFVAQRNFEHFIMEYIEND